MDSLTVDTVPLLTLPGASSAEFVVHIDESAGVVHLDPTRAETRM
jgi:hypothetical protein